MDPSGESPGLAKDCSSLSPGNFNTCLTFIKGSGKAGALLGNNVFICIQIFSLPSKKSKSGYLSKRDKLWEGMGAHRIDNGTQLRKCTGTKTTLNQEEWQLYPQREQAC